MAKAFFHKLSRSPWFTLLLLLCGAVGVGVLSLVFSPTANRLALMWSYVQRPFLLMVNILPGLIISLVVWFLTNRPLAAYLVSSTVIFGFTMVNWYKLQFRGDPLVFEDLLLIKEAGNMLGRYSLFMTWLLALALLLLVSWAVVVGFLGKWRFPPVRDRFGWLRFVLAALLIAACVPLFSVYTSEKVYTQKMQNYEYINPWSEPEVYSSKGFVYSFLHSIPSAFQTPPDGYSEEDAEAVLSEYKDADIPEDKKVDVIAVMLEAFNDFSKYEEIPFTQDVYAPYHALEEESFRGNLVTSIFGAGTIDTERAFLAGYVTGNKVHFKEKTNSFAWYLADQGYVTTGSHPGDYWFYDRTNVNANLGFDTYLFRQNHYHELSGWIAPDSVLFPELNRLYEEHRSTSSDPYFSFSVTYQGHGPYDTTKNTWDETFIEPGVFSEASENVMNNYFGSVKSTSEAISSFVDFYRDREDPVVIVIFGDHNPWMGDDQSVYHEVGMNMNVSEKEGFVNYYATRYLIWANDAAKETLGNDFVGEGPDISPHFLMSQVFDLCGWEGPAFMQYQRDVREELPVIQDSPNGIDADGNLVAITSGDLWDLRRQYLNTAYYTKTHFQYRDVWEERKKAS